MSNPQIYKVIVFSGDCLGRHNEVQGQAVYVTDKLSVAKYLKNGARVFLYPEGIEVTEANVELICQKQN